MRYVSLHRTVHVIGTHPVIRGRNAEPHALLHKEDSVFHPAFRVSAVQVQAGEVEHCLPVPAFGSLARQLDNLFPIAFIFQQLGIGFERARLQEPGVGFGINGRNHARFNLAGEVGAMRIEKEQFFVTGEVAVHFAA